MEVEFDLDINAKVTMSRRELQDIVFHAVNEAMSAARKNPDAVVDCAQIVEDHLKAEAKFRPNFV